jgi:hypothetical protein
MTKDKADGCHVCAEVGAIAASLEWCEDKLEPSEAAHVAGAAYIKGIAFGFNIRHDKTFIPTCKEHGEALTTALKAAGSESIAVSKGGDA